MKNITAILSLLHEPSDVCSATRLFRGEPVLRWTIERLTRSRHIGSIAVLCWEDQLEAIMPLAGEERAYVLSKGPRTLIPQIESVAAARRWADGWRGGLLATCDFDRGFYAPWHLELTEKLQSGAVVLVDPAAALVDPLLVDGVIEHAESRADLEICFAPTAPGLCGPLLRPSLLRRLAEAKTHAGRIFHYHPDQISRESLASECCAPVPTSVARTIHRFTLDSHRQIARMEGATESLNGQLVSTAAEELVARLQACKAPDQLPREIVLELNTSRSTNPIFWPGRSLSISRPPFSLDQARQLFSELASVDETRLTIAGVGDPLLAPEVFTLSDAAKMEAGLSISIETDLYDVTPDRIDRLAASPIDVVAVHIPAISARTYAQVMGIDGYTHVLENIRRFVQARKHALPLLAPIFTKCQANLAEMEAWYDQWLRAAGSAVIRGPSDCAGQTGDVSVADMSPPGRRPCARLSSRLTILSDGSVVSCEEDVLGRQLMGRIGTDSLRDIWSRRFEKMRRDHAERRWANHPFCQRCREWHRP